MPKKKRKEKKIKAGGFGQGIFPSASAMFRSLVSLLVFGRAVAFLF